MLLNSKQLAAVKRIKTTFKNGRYVVAIYWSHPWWKVIFCNPSRYVFDIKDDHEAIELIDQVSKAIQTTQPPTIPEYQERKQQVENSLISSGSDSTAAVFDLTKYRQQLKPTTDQPSNDNSQQNPWI